MTQERTVQQMADFYNREAMRGRGQCTARLDPRGLLGAAETGMPLAIVPPDAEHSFDAATNSVFARAVLL